MNELKNLQEELPPIKDKIQQIFKFLEIADVSQWQGMNVFEAGDSDSLYGILETAFEQVHTLGLMKGVEIVESVDKGGLLNEEQDSIRERTIEEIIKKLKQELK